MLGRSSLDVGSTGSYDINVGPVGSYAYPSDPPAAPYTDKGGTFYFQQSASLYLMFRTSRSSRAAALLLEWTGVAQTLRLGA